MDCKQTVLDGISLCSKTTNIWNNGIMIHISLFAHSILYNNFSQSVQKYGYNS